MPASRLCNSCGRIVSHTERGLGPCCAWIRAVYRSERWRRVRQRVLERDGYRCRARVDGERCRVVGRGLQAHHVMPLRRGGEPFDEANLMTLCDRHHRLADRAAA